MGLFSKLFKRKPKDDKYALGLHKTKEQLGQLKLVLEKANKIDDDLFDELEDIFIKQALVLMVIYFINELKKMFQ